MNNKLRRMSLSMLMIVAGAASLTACAMEQDPDKEARSDQSLVTADEQKPDEAAAAATSPASGPTSDITPRVSCRRVVVSSIPVFTAPNSNSVRCSFFSGDKFSYFGVVQSPGFPQRLITWCPRGVPPSQGTTSYAQIAGTVDGGCG